MPSLNARTPRRQEMQRMEDGRWRVDTRSRFILHPLSSILVSPWHLGVLTFTLLCTVALVAAPPPTPAADETIEGVQVAALDQPRVYMEVYRTANGQPLKTKGDEATSAIE